MAASTPLFLPSGHLLGDTRPETPLDTALRLALFPIAEVLIRSGFYGNMVGLFAPRRKVLQFSITIFSPVYVHGIGLSLLYFSRYEE